MVRAALIAAALASCALSPAAGAKERKDKDSVPSETQAEVTPQTALMDYLRRDMVFVDDTTISDYLESIASRLLATQPGAPPPPHFLVRSTADFSAFTDTHGNIVVGTEVLRQVESEDELAALLSHELAHVLHGDPNHKAALLNIPCTLETAAVIATAVSSSRDHKAKSSGHSLEFSRKDTSRVQDVGTGWADLLAPSWNRQQESEADLAGADMAKAAGYDTAAFSTLFSKLQAANAARSARVEAIRQAALTEAGTAPKRSSTKDNQLVNDLQSAARTVAVETAFSALTSFSIDYQPPEVRAAAVAAHLAQNSGPRRDKTARSPRFKQILRDGPAGQLLKEDRAALDLMATLASGNSNGAGSPARRLTEAVGAGEPVSSHLNLALGSWYDSIGKSDLAEQRASAWTSSDLATRSGYLWRASYQVTRGEFDEALTTLHHGAKRLGDRSLFLPQMVTVTRQKGDAPAAEKLTLDCAREDNKPSLATIQKLAVNDSQPSGLYADCVAALGYDPVKNPHYSQHNVGAELTRQGLIKGHELIDALKKGLSK